MTGTGPAAALLTGWSGYLPGMDPPPEQARAVLGRKGLLFKEPATRLALCAVHRALGLADGDPAVPGGVDPTTAVVASSNLGNVATVQGVVRTVRESGWRGVSPLAAPNASSNVMASTVAIWYGFGGPNLMVCAGATSGLDAVALAIRLLRAGRAGRVVVVGAEPDDEVAAALHAARGPGVAPLRAAAACLLLTPPGPAPAGPVLGAVRTVGEPGGGPAADLEADRYGAEGVLRVALAAGAASPCSGRQRVVVGDPADGWRAVDVWLAGAA